MRSAILALLLMSLAVAGCSVDTHRPDDEDEGNDGGGGGDGGEGGDGDGGPPPEPEHDNGVLDVALASDGNAVVEVPFPTLDSCRSPQDWMAGNASVEGAVPELRDVTGERSGKVLALTTMGTRSEWSAQIPLGPACNTLRYDPWSIDPDADNGTVEVRVEGQVTFLTVLVRWVRDGAGEYVLYEGQPSAGGWTALAEKARGTI